MIPGFNSNVHHAGVEYHVQTEDLGRRNPFVLTLVYRGGAILAREKVNYRDALGEEASEEQIKTFMEQQHKRVMASVAAGRLGESPASPEAASPAPPPKHSHPTAHPPAPPPAPAHAAGASRQDMGLDQMIAEYVRGRAQKRR